MSVRKRRRSSSVFSSASSRSQPATPRFTEGSINPLSHTPSTLKQFVVAGQPDYEDVPSRLIPGFPHRPVPRQASQAEHSQRSKQPIDRASSADEDDQEDEEDSDDAHTTAASDANSRQRKSRNAQRKREAQEKHLGFLTAVILRSLEHGNIARAKRAFGLVRRAEIQGRPVDLRKDGLWTLGAEILMRDGEQPLGRIDEFTGDVPREQEIAIDQKHRRWGSAANMPQVRIFFEGLIRRYPYSRLFPKSISALDFWPALLGCEFYNVYIEHKLRLERLEIESENWSDIGESEMPVDYSSGGEDSFHERQRSGRDIRSKAEKARVSQDAYADMREITRQMDELMQSQPYSSSTELLRLRGMMALYMGDLAMPPPPRSADEENEGRTRKTEERERARGVFLKIVEQGGKLDRWIEQLLGLEEFVDELDTPMFSSLPIR